MTYTIRKGNDSFAEIDEGGPLLTFLALYLDDVTDDIHVTTDGDLLIRMGNGYTIEKGTPKVVKLSVKRLKINEGERPA